MGNAKKIYRHIMNKYAVMMRKSSQMLNTRIYDKLKWQVQHMLTNELKMKLPLYSLAFYNLYFKNIFFV